MNPNCIVISLFPQQTLGSWYVELPGEFNESRNEHNSLVVLKYIFRRHCILLQYNIKLNNQTNKLLKNFCTMIR